MIVDFHRKIEFFLRKIPFACEKRRKNLASSVRQPTQGRPVMIKHTYTQDIQC